MCEVGQCRRMRRLDAENGKSPGVDDWLGLGLTAHQQYFSYLEALGYTRPFRTVYQ
jgi:hypothetical protein